METTFEHLDRRSKLVFVALGLTIAIDLVAIWADLREMRLMDRMIVGDAPSPGELDASDNRQAVVGVLELAVLVAAAVVFLRWFSRAYKNLPGLGASDLRFTFGWAIGAWFVPILNIWRPKQIANDIWRASDPAAAPDQGVTWRTKAVPWLLTVWWILWIASTYVGNQGLRSAFSSNTPQDVQSGDYVDVASVVLDIGAAALAIAVVSTITRRQEARVRVLAALTPVVGVQPGTF